MKCREDQVAHSLSLVSDPCLSRTNTGTLLSLFLYFNLVVYLSTNPLLKNFVTKGNEGVIEVDGD